MNQLKNRMQSLALLDRAFSALTADELDALVASLPDDQREAIDKVCGAREGGFTEPSARTIAMRSTAARGRMSGGLEQLATILTDPCLAECIEALGDHSDNPTEEQLLAVTPALIETHGLATVRLTIAASVAGEAAASVMLTRVLKHDDTLALPPVTREATQVLAPSVADDELKAKRKALKGKKQAEAKARREQQLRAKHRL
jgi:hypothetical protein